MISQNYLKTRLHYDPGTGVFTWITAGKTQHRFIGEEAGYLHKGAYIRITINSKQYLAHRLAFLYVTGSIPEYCDHINQRCNDNRWENLRPATLSQNSVNSKLRSHNTSGYRGVCWHKASQKWQVRININRKKKYLGSFDCKHHAFCEFVIASRKHHGEFFKL